MIIWVRDTNYRVYVDSNGVKHTGPIEREYWQPKTVASETSRSWVLPDGTKVPKNTMFPTYRWALTEEQVNDMVWFEEHAYKVLQEAQRLHYGIDRHKNFAQVRKIAQIIGYAE